jgi:hypothetical protein
MDVFVPAGLGSSDPHRSADRPDRPGFDRLAPQSDDYASQPIGAAFDWSTVTTSDQSGEWYLVAFRSIRRPGADLFELDRLDALAHDEASRSPGFVHYFKGPANDRGECLSFCLWDSRALARSAAGQPAHAIAAAIVHETYASYTLEFHRVRKVRGADDFEFEPYDRPVPPTHA